MLAPDMMPVTPEKRTPNTVKKLIGMESSSMEQSNENLGNRTSSRRNLVWSQNWLFAEIYHR